jgi:transposase
MPHIRFIGLDVHKKKIAVAIAEDGRVGEVLSYGSVDNTPAALAKLLQKLGKDDATLHLCYEAGGCGYGVYRQIVEAGHLCDVIAPSLIPRATGASRLTGAMSSCSPNCCARANSRQFGYPIPYMRPCAI